jgi:hypothetical protein
MARIALADDLAGGDVERGEQRRRPVPDVVVAVPLRLAGPHREHRLGAVVCLYLGRFVDAKHHNTLGRRQIQADDVAHLGDEIGISRELERLLAVRFQPEGAISAAPC